MIDWNWKLELQIQFHLFRLQFFNVIANLSKFGASETFLSFGEFPSQIPSAKVKGTFKGVIAITSALIQTPTHDL